MGGTLSSGGVRWWPVICKCVIEGDVESNLSEISPSSMFTSRNRLRSGKSGSVPGRVCAGDAISLLPEATRVMSATSGKLTEGSSWRERSDEITERDESEAAFDLKMSEIIITVVGSGQSEPPGGDVAIVSLAISPEGSSSEMKRWVMELVSPRFERRWKQDILATPMMATDVNRTGLDTSRMYLEVRDREQPVRPPS